jgi:hypothetical protein
MKVKRDEMRTEADGEVWKEHVETIRDPSGFKGSSDAQTMG